MTRGYIKYTYCFNLNDVSKIHYTHIEDKHENLKFYYDHYLVTITYPQGFRGWWGIH